MQIGEMQSSGDNVGWSTYEKVRNELRWLDVCALTAFWSGIRSAKMNICDTQYGEHDQHKSKGFD